MNRPSVTWRLTCKRAPANSGDARSRRLVATFDLLQRRLELLLKAFQQLARFLGRQRLLSTGVRPVPRAIDVQFGQLDHARLLHHPDQVSLHLPQGWLLLLAKHRPRRVINPQTQRVIRGNHIAQTGRNQMDLIAWEGALQQIPSVIHPHVVSMRNKRDHRIAPTRHHSRVGNHATRINQQSPRSMGSNDHRLRTPQRRAPSAPPSARPMGSQDHRLRGVPRSSRCGCGGLGQARACWRRWDSAAVRVVGVAQRVAFRSAKVAPLSRKATLAARERLPSTEGPLCITGLRDRPAPGRTAPGLCRADLSSGPAQPAPRRAHRPSPLQASRRAATGGRSSQADRAA